MPALLGGDISKPTMKKNIFTQSNVSKAVRYGYLPGSLSILYELREDAY